MKIEKITDKNDERLSLFYINKESTLKNLPNYEHGLFIGESTLVINRALDKGYEPVCFLIVEGEKENYNDIFKRCKDDVLVYEVSLDIFKSLKGYILIKGISCLFKRKANLSFEDVIKDSKRIVVLEEIVNPTNVGSILRNAAALFADGVLITDDSCDPLYRRSVRVSMGNVFNIDYAIVDRNTYLNKLKDNGFKTVSFALRDNSVEIDDECLRNEDKLAIILGSEGYGLDKKTIDNSDYVVKISMKDGVDSLNVVSCSGIALYELCKNNKGKRV